jgi:hypothetical protein
MVSLAVESKAAVFSRNSGNARPKCPSREYMSFTNVSFG